MNTTKKKITKKQLLDYRALVEAKKSGKITRGMFVKGMMLESKIINSDLKDKLRVLLFP